MSKITTNKVDLSYVVEETPGVTPDTPAFATLPILDGSPTLEISTEVSESLCSGRQTDDLIPVDANVAGSINYELSYGPYKPIIIQAMRGALTAINLASIDVTFANAASTITADGMDFEAEGVTPNMHLNITANGSVAENSRIYRVLSVAGDTITVSPTPEDDTATSVEFNTEVIQNSDLEPTTNTFLKRVNGTVPYYFYYVGTVISELMFRFATNTRLTGTFGVVGRTETATETMVPGQTITGCPDHSIMNSVSNIQEIVLEGLPETTCFQDLELTLNNNSTGAKCIQFFGNADVQDFSCDVTGTIVTYFEDLTLYKKFKGAESFFMSIHVKDVDGNQIIFTMPKCKFEELTVPIEGRNQFLTMPGTVRALRDADLDYTLQVEFFDAP